MHDWATNSDKIRSACLHETHICFHRYWQCRWVFVSLVRQDDLQRSDVTPHTFSGLILKHTLMWGYPLKWHISLKTLVRGWKQNSLSLWEVEPKCCLNKLRPSLLPPHYKCKCLWRANNWFFLFYIYLLWAPARLSLSERPPASGCQRERAGWGSESKTACQVSSSFVYFGCLS